MQIAIKYIVNFILQRIIITLIGFILLFTFFNFIAELDQIGKNANFLNSTFKIMVLKIPNVTYEIIPIATLIGGLWAYSELSATSEFTAFRVGGFTPQKALLTIFLGGLPLMLLTVVLSEVFIPISDKFSRDINNLKSQISSNSNFKSGFWLRDRYITDDKFSDSLSERFINIKNIYPDKSLIGVKIYDFDTDFKLIKITTALKGDYVSLKKNSAVYKVKENIQIKTNSWNLISPVVLKINKNGNTSLERYENLTLKTKLSAKTIEALTIKPEKMSVAELYSFIEYLNIGRQETNRYEIAYWKKVFYPFLLWIMLLIALPAAYLHLRKGSIGLKIFLGVIVGITYHLGNSLFSHLGLLNTWPPVTVAIFPSLLALIFGVTIFHWVQKNNI